MSLPRSIAAPVRVALAGSEPCEDVDLTAELVEAGLVETSIAGAPWPGNLPLTAAGDLGPADANAQIDAVFGWRLAAAAITTARQVRRAPITWLRPRHMTASEPEAVAALAQQFMRASAWVPNSGRCLRNSMLLINLLEGAGLPATWVFGVRTYPFDAHCWVEHEGIVLNDTIDHVRWYTPILVS